MKASANLGHGFVLLADGNRAAGVEFQRQVDVPRVGMHDKPAGEWRNDKPQVVYSRLEQPERDGREWKASEVREYHGRFVA